VVGASFNEAHPGASPLLLDRRSGDITLACGCEAAPGQAIGVHAHAATRRARRVALVAGDDRRRSDETQMLFCSGRTDAHHGSSASGSTGVKFGGEVSRTHGADRTLVDHKPTTGNLRPPSEGCRSLGQRTGRLTTIVSITEATIENRIIARQPAVPPSGRTSTFRPKRNARPFSARSLGTRRDHNPVESGYPRTRAAPAPVVGNRGRQSR
jgi:hypothetical protein